MRYKSFFLISIVLFLSWTSVAFPNEYTLQSFLSKASIKNYELSKEEKTELFNRMEEILERIKRVHRSLVQAIQGGEITMEYQEGKFWMAKLEEDRGSIESGIEQIKLLKEKAGPITPSIELYKALRDLSVNFNAYNNMALFSAYVGDLAPEIGLWADPVFYKLSLLPLAASKDREVKKEPPAKEKKPAPRSKKP
ncbi:MAG: hypothetical protein ACUVWO_03610 [Thermodesulfobacteriota bacterium]